MTAQWSVFTPAYAIICLSKQAFDNVSFVKCKSPFLYGLTESDLKQYTFLQWLNIILYCTATLHDRRTMATTAW